MKTSKELVSEYISRINRIGVIHPGDRFALERVFREVIAEARADRDPIPMMLHCPRCSIQHVDAPDGEWTNPPHRSHLCHACGCIWRPADVPTAGVQSIETRGKADTSIACLPACTAGYAELRRDMDRRIRAERAEAMRECVEIAEAHLHLVPDEVGDEKDRIGRYSNGTVQRIAARIRARAEEVKGG